MVKSKHSEIFYFSGLAMVCNNLTSRHAGVPKHPTKVFPTVLASTQVIRTAEGALLVRFNPPTLPFIPHTDLSGLPSGTKHLFHFCGCLVNLQIGMA